jgi:hypothetical protein
VTLGWVWPVQSRCTCIILLTRTNNRFYHLSGKNIIWMIHCRISLSHLISLGFYTLTDSQVAIGSVSEGYFYIYLLSEPGYWQDYLRDKGFFLLSRSSGVHILSVQNVRRSSVPEVKQLDRVALCVAEVKKSWISHPFPSNPSWCGS